MTIEYLVLGILLIIMGIIQIWLRRGLEAGQGRQDQETVGGRRGEEHTADRQDADQQGADRQELPVPAGAGKLRSGPLWQAWTRILGFVGIALGIALIVVGALGR